MKTTRSLQQYAYASLPTGSEVPIQFIRSVQKKRPVSKPTRDMLSHRPRSRQASLKMTDIVQTLRNKLSMYMETNPNVGLDVLSNLYVLFQNNILRTRILNQFMDSRDPLRVLNGYVYGDENICLLMKYSRKIYLVVLKGKYWELMTHERQVQLPAIRTPTLKHATDQMLSIAFAVPIKGSTPFDRLPVPFQQESPVLPLSSHLEI